MNVQMKIILSTVPTLFYQMDLFMVESEYLVELKRRRAITQSFTWKIALPFWKLERWIRAWSASRQQASMRNFIGLPPRTEEVFADLQRERARQAGGSMAPTAKTKTVTLMRLVIDLQTCQGSNRHRGIGRYSLSLAKAMAASGRQSRSLAAAE